MSIFTPVYPPTSAQQSFLTLRQKRERKRKRDSDADPDDGNETTREQSPEPTAQRTATATYHHPVTKTDPYHIAGHSRELPLPPPPFPHAAVKKRDYHPQGNLDEELASLNPPLYVAKADSEPSLKRRHIHNLTTVLHSCVLRGDWQRASRAFGLLLRTEVSGRGIDVRQNGRWGIGAEALMRRDAAPSHLLRSRSAFEHDDEMSLDPTANVNDPGDDTPSFTDQGFQLAREYYERLTLHYPYTPATRHGINAMAFYPALFNVWIYEVQDRSKRAQRNLARPRRSSPDSDPSEALSEDRSAVLEIRKRELEEALPIAQRMDDLLLSPPYDASLPLLRLRGMAGLWLVDLYAQQESVASESDEEDDMHRYSHGSEGEASRRAADEEKQKAMKLLRKARDAGEELPRSVQDFLEANADAMSE